MQRWNSVQKVIGVRFKKAGRIYYYNPGQVEIERGEYVIIETQRGIECLEVVMSPREIADDKIKIGSIVRKATTNDLIQLRENEEKIQDTFATCLEKIKEHKLPMNLISVEYTFDASKIIFSFTAEGRVDFRELVKDLAAVFRTRIELRQVGVRDEAKLLGGIGCCGRPLCCAAFLGDFIPVSIRMAKDQNLSLNPAKISGICGRLMCCLKYESDYYCEHCPHEITAIKEPVLGMRVIIDEGEGKVISINRQRRTATIILDNSKTAIASWDNIFEAEEPDEEVKTVVATVIEEENIVAENENTPITAVSSNNFDRKADKFSRKGKKSQVNQTFSSQLKSNFQAQNRSNTNAQNKPNVQNRDVKNSRDNREIRAQDNRKLQKHGRRTEYYQRNKRVHQHRREEDRDD